MTLQKIARILLIPFQARLQPARWPFITVLLCLSFIATASFFKDLPDQVRREVTHSLDSTHIAGETSRLLVEYCESNLPEDKDCDDDAAASALYIVNHDIQGLSPAAVGLVWQLRKHEQSFAALPGFDEYSFAANWTREGMSQISDIYHVLVGTHWTFSSAVLSLWLHMSMDRLWINLLYLLLVGILLERQIQRLHLLAVFVLGAIVSSRLFVPFLTNDFQVFAGCSSGVYVLFGMSAALIAKRLESIEGLGMPKNVWDWAYGAWAVFVLVHMVREVWLLQAAPIPWGQNNVLHLVGFGVGLAWGVFCFFLLPRRQPSETLK